MAIGRHQNQVGKSSHKAGAQAREKSEPPNVLGEQYRTTRSGRCFAEDSVKPQPVEPQVPSRKRQKVVHTADGTASQIQQDPATQSRPASARRPHIPEENLRTVRPRPLHIKDKVKVFWGTQAEKVQDVDNGAFAQWLQRAEQEQRLGADPTALVGSCQAQVMVVGHEFKAPSQMHNVAKVPSPSKAPAPQPESSRIAIPAYRRLQPSQEPGWPQPPSSEPAYIRYVPPDEDDLEGEVEYDLDEDDLAWLVKQRSSLSRALRAALTDSMLEQVLDRFEKASHAAAKLRLAQHESESSPGPDFSDLEELFPLVAAGQACTDLDLDASIVEAVRGFWLAKRAALGRPLLPRLWFEQPWAQQIGKSAQAEAELEDAADEAEQEQPSCMPFMGRDSPRGPTGRGRPLGLPQACELIWAVRAEMDTARTAADQVRRKEKQHKQQLAGHMDAMKAMLSSKRSSSKGQPRSMPDLAPEAAHDHHILQLIASVARQAGQLGNIEMPSKQALSQPPQPSSPASSLSCSPSADYPAEQLQPDKPPLPQTRSRLAHPLVPPVQARRKRQRPAGSAPLQPASGLPAAHPTQLKTGPRQKAAPGPPHSKRTRLQQASGAPGSQQQALVPSARSQKAQEQQQRQARSSRARGPVAAPRQHGRAQVQQQRSRAQPAGPSPSASKHRPKTKPAEQGPAQKRQEAGAAQHAAPASSVGRCSREQGGPPRHAPADRAQRRNRRQPARAATKSAAEASSQPASRAPHVPAAATGPAQAVRTRQHVHVHGNLHPAASSPVDEASIAGAQPQTSSSIKPPQEQSQLARSPPRSRKPLAKPVQVPASKWPGLRRLIAQIGLPQFRLYSQVNALGHIKAHRGSRQLRSRPLVSLSASR